MTAHALRVRDYLRHMLDAVHRVQEYTLGKDSEAFLKDPLLQDAVARNIEILGEASKKPLDALPDAVSQYPGIPFGAIYGMRNQLSHGYFAVDWDTVWKTIERDIPILRDELDTAIKKLDLPPA